MAFTFRAKQVTILQCTIYTVLCTLCIVQYTYIVDQHITPYIKRTPIRIFRHISIGIRLIYGIVCPVLQGIQSIDRIDWLDPGCGHRLVNHDYPGISWWLHKSRGSHKRKYSINVPTSRWWTFNMDEWQYLMGILNGLLYIIYM